MTTDSIMHFDKTGQCSEGRISASISTGLLENTRINDNFHIELVLMTHLHISHELPAKFGPNSPVLRIHVARMSRDTRAIVVRHSRDIRATKLGILGTCDCRTTVTRMSSNSRMTAMREKWERCQAAGKYQAAGRCQAAAAAGRYHYVSNQSQFSFIGPQPLTKSHISRTFLLTETKLRRIRDGFETPAMSLCDYFERKFVVRIFEHG